MSETAGIRTPAMWRLWLWLKGTDGPILDGWQRPRPSRRGILLDVAIGVALGLGSMASWSIQRFLSPLLEQLGSLESPVDPWFAGLCALAYAASFSIRRIFPLGCLLLVTAVYIAAHAMQYREDQIEAIALCACFYSAGAWSNRRTASALLRFGFLGSLSLGTLFLSYLSSQEILARIQQAGMHVDEVHRLLALFALILNVTVMTCVFLFGNSSYRRAALTAFLKEQRSAYREQAEQLRAERKLVAEQAVRLDRLAIARDLHDIVAHHVSIMGLQAAGARRIMTRDPQAAQHALLEIENSSRSAVSELQGMLTALRDPEVEPGTADSHTQAPSTRSIEQLGELVAEYRRAGGRIGFQVIGEPCPVPPVIAITAYRIMQESLTNIRKHVGFETDADVRLRYLPGTLELEISDCGPERGFTRDQAGLWALPRETAAPGGHACVVLAHAGRTDETASSSSGAALPGTALLSTAPARAARAISPHPLSRHAGSAPGGSGHAVPARGEAARGAQVASGPVGGRGLLGMRERVQAVRGAFEAGPRSGGGFRVRARLPLISTAAGPEGA